MLLFESKFIDNLLVYAKRICEQYGLPQAQAQEILDLALGIDPTNRKNFTPWILKAIRELSPSDDQLDRISKIINEFIRLKNLLPKKDINQYATFNELEFTVRQYKLIKSKSKGGTSTSLHEYKGTTLISRLDRTELYEIADPDSLADITEGTSLCLRRSYPDGCMAFKYIDKFDAIYLLLNNGVIKAYITPDLSEIKNIKNEPYLPQDLNEFRLIISISSLYDDINNVGIKYLARAYKILVHGFKERPINLEDIRDVSKPYQHGIKFTKIVIPQYINKRVDDNDDIDFILLDADPSVASKIREEIGKDSTEKIDDEKDVTDDLIVNIRNNIYNELAISYPYAEIDISVESDYYMGEYTWRFNILVQLDDKYHNNKYFDLPEEQQKKIINAIKKILGSRCRDYVRDIGEHEFAINNIWELNAPDIDISILDDIPPEIFHIAIAYLGTYNNNTIIARALGVRHDGPFYILNTEVAVAKDTVPLTMV